MRQVRQLPQDRNTPAGVFLTGLEHEMGLKAGSLRLDAAADQCGLDSIDAASVVFAVERFYGVRFDDERLHELLDVTVAQVMAAAEALAHSRRVR